tara:strand:- start:1129 stop:2091 length:963 start_codon:yes stop_codon:yes gene_type:complete
MSIPWGPIISALATIGTAKYASNTRNDPKAAIGSGTAPTLQPGGDIQVVPVEGSDVQDFGDFEVENMAEPENLTEEEKFLMMLQESGVDPEGLLSLGFGGPVQNKNNGGGLFDLFPDLAIDFKQYADSVDFANPIMEKPLEETMVDQIAQQEASENGVGKITIDDVETPEVGQEQTGIQKFANIYATNPELFETGVGSLTKVLATLMTDPPKQAGSMVRTQTLPGNSARRRSAQMNIQPIGGSKVTFANQGKALQRPMFMPHGGQMRGPGGPKDDLIPVMASNGEYMLSKAAVDAAGGGSHAKGLARLDAFNKMGNQRYG